MKRLLALLLSAVLIAAAAVSVNAAELQPPYAAPSGASTEPDAGAEAIQIPKIEVTTENGNGASLEKEDGYVNAQIRITGADDAVLESPAEFKVRGNSTALSFVKKKAFTFKFSKKADVLGMGKGKKWAMLANCFDPTLLRNYTVFDLARRMELPYTSEQRFVRLYLDGAYHGCYTVYEPIQEGKDRVNINIEGNNDFLLEYEAGRVEEDVTYLTVDGLRFAVSEPDPPTDEQTAYITSVMTDMIDTIKSGDEEAIRQKLDVDSFAKYYLLNEYAKTADFGYSSVFFFCKGGKLYAGPPWDYDLALGNLNGELNAANARMGSVSDSIMQNTKNLYRYLCPQEWFMNEIKRVYARYYDDIAGISADGGTLDSLREQYGEEFALNFTVWQINKWWLNYQKRPLSTYEENYQYLKNWCAERHDWLSDYYGLYPYSFLRGDADGNHQLDVSDVTIIQRILAGSESDPDGKAAVRAALSGDNLEITDATVIQRYLAMFGNPYHLNENTRVILY